MDSQITYWMTSARHDLEVAQALFETQRFDWCLFIAHLVLEKTLKAHYVKNIGEIPPRTHDLVRLAALAEVEFEPEVLEFLDSVNTFNISTRYPDEKFKFYQLCTYEFARENFYRIKEIFRWLSRQIQT